MSAGMDVNPNPLHDVLRELQAERVHQVQKGWTHDHDDSHDDGGLIELAIVRLQPPTHPNTPVDRRALVEAAALIVAEIQRIDRASS